MLIHNHLISTSGYDHRRHIGKAIGTRSKAAHNALDRYNDAARALKPPARTLDWEEVVEYTMLAEFDLLRDSRDDPRRYPWTTVQGRKAQSLYIEYEQALAEVERLNVEIPRVYTHLHDDEVYLQTMEAEYRTSDPVMAFHISEYRMVRGRFSDYHHRRIQSIALLPHSTLKLGRREAVHPYSADDPDWDTRMHAEVPIGIFTPDITGGTTTIIRDPLDPEDDSNDVGEDWESDDDEAGGVEDDVERRGAQVEVLLQMMGDDDEETAAARVPVHRKQANAQPTLQTRSALGHQVDTSTTMDIDV